MFEFIKWAKIALAAKKIPSVVFSFMKTYRTLIIVGGLVASAFIAQYVIIKVQNTKIKSRDKTIIENQVTIERITQSNHITSGSLTKCLAINSRINEDLIDVDNKNKLAVDNITKLKDDHNEQIKKIKEEIKPVTICDNNNIDDDFSERMRKPK